MHDVALLYRDFDPLRAIGAQETDLYVDWQREVYPAGQDPSSQLVEAFQSASPRRPITLLLAGQRGVGKTTELSRIRRLLAHAEGAKKSFVSTLRAQEFLDLEDVRPEDLVIQIVRQLVADLDAAGMDVSGLGVTALLGNVAKLVMSTRPGGSEPLDPLAIGFTRKELAGDRDDHREMWRRELPAAFDLVNDELLPAAREYLRHDGYEDLLLVVDDLDKIPRKAIVGADRTNHESLLLPPAVNSASESISLRGLRCSLVLTVPIEMTIGSHAAQLRQAYGGAAKRISCLPLVDREGNRIERTEAALLAILSCRAEHAGLDAAMLFDDVALLHRVVRLSGGNIRALLGIVTGLLDMVDDLPIGAATVDRYVASRAAGFVRALHSSHLDILQRVARGASPTDDPRFFDLLLNRYVYVYEDGAGDAWYRLNPVLQEIDL